MPQSKPTVLDAAIGARVRAMRIAAAMNQTVLGRNLGITFQQVQKFEKGANKLSVNQLKTIADVFGTSVGTILSQAVNDTKDNPEGPNPALELLGTLGGAELAKIYVGLEGRPERLLLLQVARALSRTTLPIEQ